MLPVYRFAWDENMADYHRRVRPSRALTIAQVVLVLVLGWLLVRPAHAQSTVQAGVDPIGWLRQPFTFSGWAFDTSSQAGTGVDLVQVYAHQTAELSIYLGEATYGHTRPDVAAHHGVAWTNVGWTFTVDGLPAGQYQLMVQFRSTVTGLLWSTYQTVTIGTTLGVWIETPLAGAVLPANTPFVVKGGAVDFGLGHPGHPGTFPSLSTVLVRRAGTSGPLFLNSPDVTYRQVTFGGARPEIAAALGLSFSDIGWEVAMPGLPPGDYDVIFMGTTHPDINGVRKKFENETAVVRITVQPQ